MKKTGVICIVILSFLFLGGTQLLSQETISAESVIQLENSYAEILKVYAKNGYKPTSGVEIEISGLDYVAVSSSDAVSAEAGVGGKEKEVLVWGQEDSWIEYSFNIPKNGLYNINLVYYPLPGKRGSIQRELLIDGDYPFRDAKSIVFPRTWQDEHTPRQDNQGNDIRPRQVEIPLWMDFGVFDAEGLSTGPLLFHFSEGTHTLRMVAIKEPVAIDAIRIYSPITLPGYKEVQSGYARNGYREAEDTIIKIQAENAYYKTDPTLRMEHSSGVKVEPYAGTYRKFNVFGGGRWRRGNQQASWKFSVDKSGLYRIGMSIRQYWNSGLPSIRTVEIDGKVPFKEVEELTFPYSLKRQYYYFGGETPYLFYLEKGEHLLTLTAKIGPVRSVIDTIERTVQDVSKLQRDITLVTGVDPDPNREWDTLPETIPHMLTTFQRVSKELAEQAVVLKDVTATSTKSPAAINVLLMASEQFANLTEKLQTIPYRLDEVTSTLTQLTTWLLDLKEQPLEIDYIAFESTDSETPRVYANFFEELVASWNAFALSFRKNYEGIGNIYETGTGKPVLKVWVARGREWVEIIKEMIDENFTPESGIPVNVNILPAGQMNAILLNAIAGKAPDVVLGMAPNLPVDYGVRGALVNLNQFPDYEEVVTRFRPGALVPFHFRGEDYAVPEVQNFSMLFYRTDIMNELGLKIPETWDDVYDILPTLQVHGMNFYYAGVAAVAGQVHNGLLPFLLQRGGEFYTDDQMSALDTSTALTAFTQWTELYTNWKIPPVANFYNRFRTGEMPIGISDYMNYLTLSVGAPELKGWWKMVPIPGIMREDGRIDRSAGGAGEVGVIFNQSNLQEEGWEFLKWWTGTEIQGRFAEELEALIGLEARWNTANIEAMKSLPWPNDDIEAILEQWKWFKEQPIVLGGYFTSRHVEFAWARVVLQGENPRAALELAYEDINVELRRKQIEFGYEPPPLVKPDLTIDIDKYLKEKR